MKVSEAKEKVCPFIQNGAITAGKAYFDKVDQFTPANINCICGDCMAWIMYKDSEKQEGYCARIGQ